jgi:hypothetical protein
MESDTVILQEGISSASDIILYLNRNGYSGFYGFYKNVSISSCAFVAINYQNKCGIINNGIITLIDSYNFNAFVRSNIVYDNGILTLKFSDVKGGANQNNEFDKTQLYKETISTNFPLNNSKVVIDFNKGEYIVTKHDGTTL